MITAAESLNKITDMEPFSSWTNGQPPKTFVKGPVGPKEAEFYQENGYLVLDRVLSEEEVDEINAEAVRICRNAGGTVEGVSPAPPNWSDEEVMAQILCLHFPHKMSDVMKRALSHPAIVQALTQIVSPNVKAMQSMLFLKAAGKPGQAWHQDEDFIPTRDRTLAGVWIALDDATIENGCLWLIPGSQKRGILWKLEWHGDHSFDCVGESQGFPYTVADEIPAEVKKGSVVFFNGYTLHRSLPNRAKSGFRRALVNHYSSAETFLPWRVEEGTSISWTDWRDIVMVAGEDPYAWKGLKDLSQPSVRPTGEGGCIDWVTKQPLPYKNENRL